MVGQFGIYFPPSKKKKKRTNDGVNVRFKWMNMSCMFMYICVGTTTCMFACCKMLSLEKLMVF